MMKIWKLKKLVGAYSNVINLVPKQEGTEAFWDDLKQAIIFNKSLSFEQFSALYYAVGLCRTATASKQPDILVVNIHDKERLDEFERSINNPYDELHQNLYITLVLSKENGKEFAEGSSKYTDEEYKDFHNSIMEEIAVKCKKEAEIYVRNLDKLKVTV